MKPGGVGEVTFADGTSETVQVRDGFVVYPVPAAELVDRSAAVALRAYDAAGKQLAQRGLRVERRG